MWILILAVFLLLSAGLLFVSLSFGLLLNIRKTMKDKKRLKIKPVDKNLNATYLNLLDEIFETYQSRKIDKNDFYYEVSKTLKLYAEKKTGINTHSLTLSEIDNISGLHLLSSVIKQIYFPQFSNTTEDKNSDNFEKVIDLGKSMIKQWGS